MSEPVAMDEDEMAKIFKKETLITYQTEINHVAGDICVKVRLC